MCELFSYVALKHTLELNIKSHTHRKSIHYAASNTDETIILVGFSLQKKSRPSKMQPILKSFGKAEMEVGQLEEPERQQLNHLAIWRCPPQSSVLLWQNNAISDEAEARA